MFHCSNYDKIFINQVITGEKMWVYGYDVEIEVQSSQWVGKFSPRAKIACLVWLNIKVMPTIFYDNLDIIHDKFILARQTLTNIYY